MKRTFAIVSFLKKYAPRIRLTLSGLVFSLIVPSLAPKLYGTEPFRRLEVSAAIHIAGAFVNAGSSESFLSAS